MPDLARATHADTRAPPTQDWEVRRATAPARRVTRSPPQVTLDRRALYNIAKSDTVAEKRMGRGYKRRSRKLLDPQILQSRRACYFWYRRACFW